MKAFTLVALGMMLSLNTCAVAPSYAAENTAKLASQMLNPVAQLNRGCSATFIESKADKDGKISTILLTAKHCTDGSKLHQEVYVPIYVDNRIIGEQLFRATVDREDYKADLATLKLLDTTTVFTNIATVAKSDVPLFEGEDVYTVGYSAGQTRVLTTGTFGNRESIPFPTATIETEYFRATSNIVGGNSGGSLFHKNADTDNFELIGVTSAVNRGADFIGYYVTVDKINDFLKNAAPLTYGDADDKKTAAATH